MGKTVFLIRGIRPEEYGGGEMYQIKLGTILVSWGFEVFIVTSSEKLLKEAKRKKIKTIQLPYCRCQNWSGWKNILFPFYCLNIIRLKKWYKKVFERVNPDIVNIQSRDDWIAATSVAKKMGSKVLWTDHADFRSWVLTNINVWYKNWIGKWVLRCAKKADKIIMISDFEKKNFERIVEPREYKNLVTVKNGVGDENRKYRNIKNKIGDFCYVGRIVDYKGISELIEAFGKVSGKYPNTILNIYGDGEDFEKYKALASGNKRIYFHGRTDEPLKVLAENEIFVLPSYREGLSLSLLDAAMMEKKIIASNVDGNPEVVINKKTGLLVPVKDKDKLAEAMIYMLKNKKEASEMAKNARQYYKDNFDFDKIFKEKMLLLYNNKEEE